MLNRNKLAVSSNRIYYNIVVVNNEQIETFTDAIYRRNLDEILVDDPSQYYLSVMRFSVPTANIPLMIPEILQFPNTDVNKTAYVITMTYNGFTSGPINIQFETTTPLVTPRSITADNPYPMVNPSRYYWIFNYSQFVKLINDTYQIAFDLLNTATGNALAGQKPPLLLYDSKTYLLTMQYTPIYLSSNPDNARINLFVNYKLFSYLDGFDNLFLDSKSDIGAQFTVFDKGDNFDGTVYDMIQNYKTLASWNVFKSLQLRSNLIPIKKEYLPVPFGQNPNALNGIGILRDFIPIINDGPEARTSVSYIFDSAYQMIDLNSNTPLQNIDMSVYWEDRYGNIYLLTVPYNQVLSIKIAFIKKDSFTG